MPLLNLDFFFIVPLIISEIYAILMFERSVHAIVAISRKITINELNNAWNYKYIYAVEKLNNHEKKNAYNHKHQSLCRNILNVILFFCRCNTGRLKL